MALLPVQAFAAAPQTRIGVRHAKDYLDGLNEDINAALRGFEEIFYLEYEDSLKETKRRIEMNDWDFEYTMDSFYNQGNPFAECDFESMIAAYATALEDGSREKISLYDIPYLRTTFKERDNPGEEGHYGDVIFETMDADDMVRYMGLDPADPGYRARYVDRLALIKEALQGVRLSENVFIRTPASIKQSNIDFSEYLKHVPGTLEYESPERYNIVATALSLVGGVPYDWGGKPSQPGYDPSWWTYNESTKRQRGLDCSGFVEWVFMTAGYPKEVYSKVYYTGAIRVNLQEISAEELRPGDIGLKNNTDNGTNHTGIYLGDGKWIHCSSSGGTVVVNNGSFRYYRRAPLMNTAEFTQKKPVQRYFRDEESTEGFFTDEDVYLLAQVMEHEAGGEPYNGRIAVAEVVLNRIHSSKFPNTLYDVVYQKSQFENNWRIKTLTPRQETIDTARMVLDGKLKIFNNPDVQYFKNPLRSGGHHPEEQVDWVFRDGSRARYFTFIGSHAFYLVEGA